MKDELDILSDCLACVGAFLLLAGLLCQSLALGLLGFALAVTGLFFPR